MTRRAFRREAMQATLEIAAFLQREYALTFEYACIATMCAMIERAVIIDASGSQPETRSASETRQGTPPAPPLIANPRLSSRRARRRSSDR
jgi:hypothetical protein